MSKIVIFSLVNLNKIGIISKTVNNDKWRNILVDLKEEKLSSIVA